MTIDQEVIQDRLARVRNEIRLLKRFREIDFKDFELNEERQRAVLHSLQLAFEGCADVAFHICAAESLGAPHSYSEAFESLARTQVITSERANTLRQVAALRNRIVHDYAKIDLRLIYDIIHNHLDDLELYVSAVELHIAEH